MNKVIAQLGAKAFFSMLMKYNLAHADCHAGNILVRIRQNPSTISDKVRFLCESLEEFVVSKVVKYGFKSAFLRKLTEEHYAYQNSIEKETEKYNEKVDITLIDMGMAVCLSKEKKTKFLNFLEEIIKGDPLECAKWIYRVSMH